MLSTGGRSSFTPSGPMKVINRWHVPACGPADSSSPRCVDLKWVLRAKNASNVDNEDDDALVPLEVRTERFEREEMVEYPGAFSVFLVVLVLVSALVMNLHVLSLFLRKRSLRTSANWLVASMAAADLGVAVMVMPLR